MTTHPPNIDLPLEVLGEFCRRWKITELSLFGSALRADFAQSRELDLLVSFATHARWSLLDHVEMENELTRLLGHRVNLISRRAVERSHNWIRRQEILQTAQVVYESR